MRYQILYASVATILATLTNAQNLGDLPMCAVRTADHTHLLDRTTDSPPVL